ncbi:Mbeg1-like protein [Paenibacillus terrigena]|uniref:Mbeg1-like protein n=1 Tax=Paenibacillus terrigena TaxID=369333 RepID=UPI0028D903CA|nr:Mbeg1-like protein [Paenibacillus terrigena]
MIEPLTEVELRQIAQLVYLDVEGQDSKGNKTKLYKAYQDNMNKIELGEVIDYYLGEGNYEGNLEGVKKLEARFPDTVNGKNEYELYKNMLMELNQKKYQKMIITNVVSHNKKEESGFVAVTIEVEKGVNVVTFRGSEPMSDPLYRNDWKNNGTTSYINESLQQMEAKNYILDMIKQGKFPSYLTGHSLGGNLALFSSFILPDEYRKRLISATTFNAPGFNGSLLAEYSKQIEELNQQGKLKEFRNVEDIVPALFMNPSKGIYIKTLAEGFGFAHHSMFSYAMGEDGTSFKRADVQASGTIPSIVHNLTVGLEIVPGAIKQLLITEVFNIWDGRIEFRHFLYAALGILTVVAIGPIAALEIAVTALLSLIAIGFIIDKVIPWIKEGIQNLMESINSFWEQSVEFITEMVKEAVIAYNLFADKMEQIIENVKKGVKKFCDDLKKGFKKFVDNMIQYIKAATDFWIHVKNKVAQKLDDIVGNIKENVKQMKDNFIKTVDSIKGSIDKIKAKALKTITGFMFGVSSAATGVNILANLDRVEGLQLTLQRKEEKLRDLVNRIQADASRVASDVGRNYSEYYYVQAQLRRLEQVSDRIRTDHRRAAENLQQKSSALRSSVTKYREVESTIIRVSRAAIRPI